MLALDFCSMALRAKATATVSPAASATFRVSDSKPSRRASITCSPISRVTTRSRTGSPSMAMETPSVLESMTTFPTYCEMVEMAFRARSAYSRF
jgi:hypothetical protein